MARARKCLLCFGFGGIGLRLSQIQELQGVDPSKASGAVFDRSGRYRYLLWRSIEDGGGKGTVCFVMLNPHKADAKSNDPTITRCVNFVRTWGYDRLSVVNLFAYMAKEPRELILRREPVGQLNDRYIYGSMVGADLIVAAWGNYGSHMGRSTRVLSMAKEWGLGLQCLDRNATGEPKHPLYLPKTATPLPFSY